MSSQESSLGNANNPETNSRNHVLVTGAGFTRALVPDAPLLVDDFNNEALKQKVLGLRYASRLLDWERNLHPKGHINIERLMTRLDALMPYDYAEEAGNAANEYALLLSELKIAFIDRLRASRMGQIHDVELSCFAEYCLTNGYCCITFNYDDFLDEALEATGSWKPNLGYGFFCPSWLDTIDGGEFKRPSTAFRLLKLHGSINWRPKLGNASPFAIDSITYRHDWSKFDYHPVHLPFSLEPEPVMVPPVLSKSGLVEQPVLRLVWSHAYASLQTAHEVTFIGYSIPTTDLAARTLFSEALKDLPRKDIRVVNLSHDDSEAEATRERYRSVLGDLPDEQFCFDGARTWIQDLSL